MARARAGGSSFQGLRCKTPFNCRAVCGALCEAGSSRGSQGHCFRRGSELRPLSTAHALHREPKSTPRKVYGLVGSPERPSAAQRLLSQDSGFETVALRPQGRDVTHGCDWLWTEAHLLLPLHVLSSRTRNGHFSNLEGNL